MGWFGDSSWDPGNWSGLGDVPIVGDLWKGLTGDPKGIQQAYDKQIAAAQQQSAAMKEFLLGQKGQAQGFYGPIQHMFQQAYGTEGLQAPQIPGAPVASGAPPVMSQKPMGWLAGAYGQGMGGGNKYPSPPPMKGGNSYGGR